MLWVIIEQKLGISHFPMPSTPETLGIIKQKKICIFVKKQEE